MKRKILSLLLALCLVVGMVPVAASAAETDTGTYLSDQEAINDQKYFRIGTGGASAQYFGSLPEAVGAVEQGASNTTIVMLEDASGSGVKVDNKNITFDFNNHTYTVSGETVGSTGTETNGFQLLKGSTVTMKNGTVKASNNPSLQILIQNYCNFTLEGVTLDASEAPQCAYVASNNNGNVKIETSKIIASEGKIAFDAYYWPTNGYTEGVTVTVTNSEIEGDIEVTDDGSSADKSAAVVIEGNTKVEGDIINKPQKAANSVTIKDNASVTGTVSNTGTGKTEVTGNAKIGSVSGTVTVTETVEVTNQENGTSEAKIGTQYYATLEEAIDQASEGATIVMLKDAVFEKGILVTKKITLDMAGHSITAPSGTSIWQDADPQKPSEEDRWSFLSVRKNGDLTVTGNGKIEANENDCYAIDVQKGGKCTIENGTFIGNISAVYLIKGSVSIKGGTFDIKQTYKPDDPYALLININDQAAEKPENSIVITGGTFKGDVSEFLAEGLVWDEVTHQVKQENPEEPSTPVTPSTPTYANTVSDTENGKVTASPTRPKEGATVTITTTPDKGYEVGSVSVTDADGKAVAVTNAGNGKYTFKQPDSKVTIRVTFVWDNPFTDVGNAWYRNAIQYVYENNLMAGTGDTTFDPEVSLTRAMTAQILYNLEGKPKVDEEATFADMNEAPTWSVDAIAWAQDTGVVAGMGDNEFAPNAKVTREQFAQMMYNYAKYKKYDLTKTGDLSKFPDDGSVSDWAETAMSWANGNGLINGHEDSGLIDPAGNTIRGQAASIIMNFDKNVVK